MKNSIQLKATFALIIALLFSSLSYAQEAGKKKPIASPRDSISGMIGGVSLTINYGSPSVRGRKIWGGLVPYDTVWRTGANEATRFTTSKPIVVEGQTLPAGTYGFFAIPGKKSWTIIFNSVPNQWGAFKYDATKDVLRFPVTPVSFGKHERLVYTINDKGFALIWDNLMIPVKVTPSMVQ